MQKARGHTVHNIVLPLLVGWRFQFLFHSPPGVLFTFPSRYSFTIGHRVVFSLGRWSSQFPTGFLVPRGTQDIPRVKDTFRVRDYHPLRSAFPYSSTMYLLSHVGLLQPRIAPVWAIPRSLASTCGISFDFFSRGYLDVSVPRVRFHRLCIQQ